MRKSLVLATLVVLACTASAFAGVPDPTHSGCGLNAKPLPCQWRFRADGGIDRLTLKVTLRDAFDAPVASCSTYCNLANATPFSAASAPVYSCSAPCAGRHARRRITSRSP